MEPITDAGRLDALLDPFGGETWQSRRGRINYSFGGEPRAGTVLLIAGLSMQRTEWSPELIAGLRAAGYATLAADNRDCGLTKLSGHSPSVVDDAPTGENYTLQDMAADLRDLLMHTGTGPVHALGMSMGGMIAQHLAMLAPELVRSLVSVMSTTGHRAVGRPREAAKWVLLTAAPIHSREAYLGYAERYHLTLSGENYANLEHARWVAETAWERGILPAGTARQLAAIQADGDRTDRLRGLRLPTLVVHGDADPLIGLSGGIATAAAIPGARLVRVHGMGHTIPWQHAGTITDRVIEFFAE